MTTTDHDAMEPDFDGETYNRDLDHRDLTGQLAMVRNCLALGGWWTLRTLSLRTGVPESSVAARICDLRKEKFGAYAVESQRVPGTRLWRYRLAGGRGTHVPRHYICKFCGMES